MAPLSFVGLVAPVIGSGIALTWLSLSMVAGVVPLVIGMTGNIDCPFNCQKESQCELASPPKFLLSFSLKLKMRR